MDRCHEKNKNSPSPSGKSALDFANTIGVYFKQGNYGLNVYVKAVII